MLITSAAIPDANTKIIKNASSINIYMLFFKTVHLIYSLFPSPVFITEIFSRFNLFKLGF